MKLIILDRDGIINHDSVDYIKSADEWHAIPGSLEAIALLHQAGFNVAVASNQSGIARGLYSHNTLQAIHEKMHTEVEKAGGEISKIVYCPHMPDAGCDCRKPKPGLLYQIADHFDVPLKGVHFIGDRLTDVACARACQANPILIHSPMTQVTDEEKCLLNGVNTFVTLKQAVVQLLAQ